MVYKLEDKPGIGKSLIYAFQYILLAVAPGMTLMIVMLGFFEELTGVQKTLLVQTMLFMIGIATFSQLKFGHRLPMAQGTSAAFIPAWASVATMGYVYGLGALTS